MDKGSVHDTELKELEKVYTRALQRNKEAVARFQLLSEFGQQQRERTSRSQNASKEQSLIQHVENIRLQKQHSKLRVLSQFSNQLQNIAHEDQIYRYNAQPRSSSLNIAKDDKSSESIKGSRLQLETILKKAETLTTMLELALVAARQQLKREQALLHQAEREHGSQPLDGTATRQNEIKLNALESTRNELQGWIEENLAKCEQHGEPENTTDHAIPDPQADEDYQSRIDTEYQKYLDTRQKLVKITQTLATSTLQPHPVNHQSSTKGVLDPGRQHSRYLRPSPQLRYSSQSASHLTQLIGPSLAEIQSHSLPQHQHEKLLAGHLSHLLKQTQSQEANLLQTLNRLEHESHLLPTYPHTDTEPDERGDNIARTGTRQQVEIDRLLRAWSSASIAADDLQQTNIQKQIIEAGTALGKADGELKMAVLMEMLRRDILQSKQSKQSTG